MMIPNPRQNYHPIADFFLSRHRWRNGDYTHHSTVCSANVQKNERIAD
jgi:hypothetical protein